MAETQHGTQGAPRDEQSIAESRINNAHAPQDEESPLLGQSEDCDKNLKPKVKALTGVGTIIAVALLGTKTNAYSFSSVDASIDILSR